MKRTIRIGAICALGGLLAACGGDGGDADPGQGSASPTNYTPGTPVAGATDRFVITSVDDSGNATAVGYTQQVQSVSGAHSYVLTQADPGNSSLVVNGIDYHFDASTLTFDDGHESALTATSDGGTVHNCSFVPSGGHPWPWSVGQTYAYAVQESCTPGDVRSYTETGTVVAVEQVTVPAGTFSALKLQTTEVWTENGQTVTEQITHWVDPAHWFFTIKKVTTFARSGNVPAHYVISQSVELQGRSGG